MMGSATYITLGVSLMLRIGSGACDPNTSADASSRDRIPSCIAKFIRRLPFASRYVGHTIAMKAIVTSKTTAAAGSRSIFVINCTATTDTATDLIDELRL